LRVALTDQYARESRSFDAVAETYEGFRPGYPAALVEAIVKTAGIDERSSVLEVGSGTGKATEPFARLGCSVLCLDPGEKLVAVARCKFAAVTGVRYACTRFEDWPVGSEAFDLVFSAQAFHWVRRDIGAAKAADVLKPGGYLALFWNLYPGMEGPLADDMQRVYADVARELAARPTPQADLKDAVAARLAIIEQANRERLRYSPVQILRFPWSQVYTTAQYVGLLNTYSDHICLDAPVRTRLLDGIAAAIDSHGGTIERPYVSVLYLAQKLRT
jgi:SAM-dependent methyltransferase